jgi:hypothetical protein
MNTRILLCTAALAASIFPLAAPAPALADPGSRTDCLAQLIPARLPHSPDAVEGWVRACYVRAGLLNAVGQVSAARSSGEPGCRVRLVPALLPHTPDAIEGWRRGC